jgi:hypothetical protein
VITRRRPMFRESALDRYAANRQRDERLRDVSARLIVTLWICAGLLGGAVLAVVLCVGALIR